MTQRSSTPSTAGGNGLFVDSSRSWRKSTACQVDNGCVELARLTQQTAGVRDSTRGENGPALILTLDEFRSFMTLTKNGTYDLNQ